MSSYIQNSGTITSCLESPLPIEEKIKLAKKIFYHPCKLPPEIKEQIVLSWVMNSLHDQELGKGNQIALWDLLLTLMTSKRLQALFSQGFLISLNISFVKKLPSIMGHSETAEEIRLRVIKLCVIFFDSERYAFQTSQLLKYLHTIARAVVAYLQRNTVCMPPLLLLHYVLQNQKGSKELIHLLNGDALYLVMDIDISATSDESCQASVSRIKEELLAQVFNHLKAILQSEKNAHKLLEQSTFFIIIGKCIDHSDTRGMPILSEFLFRMCEPKNHGVNFYILHQASRTIYHDVKGPHHETIRHTQLTQAKKDQIIRTILRVAVKVDIDLKIEYKGILLNEWVGHIGTDLIARNTFSKEALVSLTLVCKISQKFAQEENLTTKLLSSEKTRNQNYNLYADILKDILLVYDRVRDLPKFLEMLANIVLETEDTLKMEALPVDHLGYTENFVIPQSFMVALENSIGQLGSQQTLGLWSYIKRILLAALAKLNKPDVSEDAKSASALVIWMCARTLGSTSIHSISNVSTVPQKLYQFLQEIATECILPIVHLARNFSANRLLSASLLHFIYIWGEFRITLLANCPECEEKADLMDFKNAPEIFDFSVLLPFADTAIWTAFISHISCGDTSIQNCLNQLVVQKLSLVSVCRRRHETAILEKHVAHKKIKVSKKEGKRVNPQLIQLTHMETSCQTYIMNVLQTGSAENIRFISLLMSSIMPTISDRDQKMFAKLLVESLLKGESIWLPFLSSTCFQERRTLHLQIFEEVCVNLQASCKHKPCKKKVALFCSTISSFEESFRFKDLDQLLCTTVESPSKSTDVAKPAQWFSGVEELHLVGLMDILWRLPLDTTDVAFTLRIVSTCLCVVVQEVQLARTGPLLRALNLMIKIIGKVRSDQLFTVMEPLSLMKHLFRPACSVFSRDSDVEIINYTLAKNDTSSDTDVKHAVVGLLKIAIDALLRKQSSAGRLDNLEQLMAALNNFEEHREIVVICSLILFSELQEENGTEETELIRNFISEGKVVGLLQTANHNQWLRQISNTFLALDPSGISRSWETGKPSKANVNLDDVILDIDQSLVFKIVDSCQENYFEHIAKRYYHTIKDSNQPDKLVTALDSWTKLAKLKLKGEKKILAKNLSENIFCILLKKLQDGRLNPDVCIKLLALHLNHCKNYSPEPHVSSLAINFIADFSFEKYSFPEFIQIYTASTQSLMYFVRAKNETMKNCLVATTHTIISLAKGVLSQSSQEMKRSKEQLQELEVCCQNLDLIITELIHANEGFVDIAHYMVEALVNYLQKSGVYPAIKRWMERCIFQLFKVTPQTKLQYLFLVMPATQIVLLKHLLATYNESYRFDIFR